MAAHLVKRLFVLFFFTIALTGLRAQQTIATLTAAAKNNPNNAAAWAKLGTAYLKLEKYTQAINSYSKALEIDPDDMKTIRSRGSAYCKLAIYDSAISDLT